MLAETHYSNIIQEQFKGIDTLKTPIFFTDSGLNLLFCNRSCNTLFFNHTNTEKIFLTNLIQDVHRSKFLIWWEELKKKSCSLQPLAISLNLSNNVSNRFWLYGTAELIEANIWIFKFELTKTSIYEEKYFSNESIEFDNINQNHYLANKSKLENVIEGTGIGVWEWCIPNGKTNVNETWANMIGYSLSDFDYYNIQNWLERVHPDDLPILKQNLKSYLKGEQKYYQGEYRMLHRDGHWIWVQDKGQLIEWTEDKEPYILFGTHTEITNEKRREIELKKALAKLDVILKSSSQVSIISTDLSGIIKTFNAGSENLLGYKAEELIDKLTPACIHVKEEVIQSGKELSQKFNEKIENFDVFIYLAKKGLYETKEWTYVRKDGSTFPVQLTVTAIKNELEEITGYLGVATDISALKKTEKELKSLLDLTKDQNQRLLNFAHIVSHNLRSHASNFSMILNVLQSEKNPEVIRELNELLLKASYNLNETIQNLNDVVQVNTLTDLNLTPIPIRKMVTNAIDNLSSIINSTHSKIIINIDENFTIHGIVAYFESICLNLISNSIKYRKKDVVPEISISAYSDGLQKTLTFEDNGLGIDLERHHAKIFGMYKTFHGNEDARGIGLFITKNQIEAMNGKIEIESQVGIGTKFKIVFYEKTK